MVTKKKGATRSRRSSGKKKIHRAKKTFPIAVIAPLALTPFIPPVDGWGSPYSDFKVGNWDLGAKKMVTGWTGFNGETGKFECFPRYLVIAGAGMLVHKGATMLGINRVMAKMPAPFNKVSI